MADDQSLFKLHWQTEDPLVRDSDPENDDNHDDPPPPTLLPTSPSLNPQPPSPALPNHPPTPMSSLSSASSSDFTSPSSSSDATDPPPSSDQHATPMELVPRGYQIELFERACKDNIIAFLETGSGKTLISALLIRKTMEDLEASATQNPPPSTPSHQSSHDDKENAQPDPIDIDSPPVQPPLPLPTAKHLPTYDSTTPQSPHDTQLPPIPTTIPSPATIVKSVPSPSSTYPFENSVFVFTKTAKPAPEANKIAVFLVHRVPLVPQQAQVIRSAMKPHVHVGEYFGEKGVDSWTSSKWAKSLRTKKVLVMTAQIFLNLLRHGLLDIRNVALLVLDEVHHATKNHPYRRLFVEFYHTLAKGEPRPRVFGMTASPVKAKAASQSSGPCLNAILALEATLDATVVTVSGDSKTEVEELVPKPDEFVVTYDQQRNEEDEDEAVGELETVVMNHVMDIVAQSEEQVSVEFGAPSADSALPSKEGELTEDDQRILRFLCFQLGYQAAARFARELCAVQRISPEKHLQALLRQCKMEDFQAGGITNKVMLLLDVLFSEKMRCAEEHRPSTEMNSARSENFFRCIVFVQERVVARALAWVINTVFNDLESSELKARSAVGAQNSDSRIRMTQTKLLQTIEEFRLGHYGILVATNVIEEGLDVPACRLVVAFDRVVSPTAYVQGRGRARKRGARYISFIARGIVNEYNDMFMAREGAKIMKDVLSCGIETDLVKERLKQKIQDEALENEKKLFSNTTRAQVTATEAVNLLHRYCVMKAANLKDDKASRPRYTVSRLESAEFTCHVTLHPKILIDGGMCTEPQETELLAKRLAALDAYSKLYQIKEVDEFLLPKRQGKSRRVLRVVHRSKNPAIPVDMRRKKRRSTREVQSKAAKKDKRLRQCRILHPAALQYGTRESKASAPTSVGNEADESSTSSKPGSNENGTGNVNLSDPDRSVALSLPESPETSRRLLYSLRVDHRTEHFGFHASSGHLKFGLVLKNEVHEEDLTAIRCPDGEDLISLTFEKEISWSEACQKRAYKYVRSIQLCLRGRCPGSPMAIEIEEKDYGKETVTGFFLVPLRQDENGPGLNIDWYSIEKLLCFGWRCGPPEQSEMRSGRQFENLLVCSYHENLDRVYLSGRLSEKLRASSDSQGNLNPSYKSFADYFERKHETELVDRDQLMLEGFCVLEKLSRLSTSTFMLPPETCRVIPLSPMICYVASLLPRWQTFLALRYCWRRNRINTNPTGFLSFARALQPNVNNVAKDCADLSYERLEFLGDAVLKVIYSMAAFVMNPHDNEGILSDERDVEVSNQRLADLAVEMKIHDCVAFSGVSQKAKAWPWFWGTHQNRNVQISEKVLADCVEALIGVQYLDGGVELAAMFMDKHKLLPQACEVLGISKDARSSGGVLVPVPKLSSGDQRRTSRFVREVEKAIGYSFLDKGHLVVALTHGSFMSGSCPSYQRYEYLGDAIIGFLLLSHFFHKYPDLSPGDLTGLRGPALSNDLFARVIVSLGIHGKFWYECPPLEAEIKKFAHVVANEENETGDVCKMMTVPKVLGDLLESIIGAIVVDKGMKLDGVQEIALRLVSAELDRFANPEKFKRNPISELVHLVQRLYNLLPEYKYLDKAQDTVKDCSILVDGKEIGRATGPTRRVAKHKAAIEGLRKLKAVEVKKLKGVKCLIERTRENGGDMNGNGRNETGVDVKSG